MIIRENCHEPIITREVWDAVHNRPRVARTATPRMLTGLLHVNGVPYGSTGGSEKRPLYSPPKGARGQAWLNSPYADDAVWSAFTKLATAPEFVERLLAAAQGPTEQEKAAEEIKFLESESQQVRRRLENLVTMRADGEISKEVFAARSKEAQQKLDAHNRELDALRAKSLLFDGSAARRVVKAVQTLLAGRTRLDVHQKRRVLLAIARRVDVAAVRSPKGFQRDAHGRILPRQAERWTVGEVVFHLSIPPETAVSSGMDRRSQSSTSSRRPVRR